MIEYVVGFAFDRQGAVALIKKNRPEWQKGLWNGIGGHVEEGETGAVAMSREFCEETGMQTDTNHWRYAGSIGSRNTYRCRVYTSSFSALHLSSLTDEVVRVFTKSDQALLGKSVFPCITNIPVLLALVQMPPDSNSGIIPVFTLDYSI